MKTKKSKTKHLIYQDIKSQFHEYNYEQQIINSVSYCPYECCDGFLPVITIENIPNDLLCYVVSPLNFATVSCPASLARAV